MRVVKVGLGKRSYRIRITRSGLEPLGPQLERQLGLRTVFVVTDRNVAEHHLPAAVESLERAGHVVHTTVIAPGETAKVMATVGQLWSTLLQKGADRRSVVVALGGGVVGDLAGFVAATFNRGIDYVQVPTSLLAQVDSSVGGKTGFNLDGLKNVIGAFHQPRLVLTCLDTLSTLPARELRAGLGEVVKHGVLGRVEILDELARSADALRARDTSVLESVVAACCEVKRDIVVADEKESGRRKLLNLGHTFGHAIETVTRHEVLHGEAVALGIVATCRLSERYGLCDDGPRRALSEVMRRLGLPVDDSPYWSKAVADAMAVDKKRSGSEIDLVLLRGIGDPVLRRVAMSELVEHVTGQAA